MNETQIEEVKQEKVLAAMRKKVLVKPSKNSTGIWQSTLFISTKPKTKTLLG